MAFSDKVKIEALVKSRRCCCVCHEFAGLYTNVHHIKPEAQGGPDTLDNAIVLCLRCHGEAGQYNSAHPIGNKYSPVELIGHRDAWLKWCQENPHIPLPAEKEAREKISAILQDRISKITKGETPEPLHQMPKVILHIIPFESIATDKKVDIAQAAKEWYFLQTIAGNPANYRRNMDGLFTFCEGSKAFNSAIQYTEYAQLFENGVIEVVDEFLLNITDENKLPGKTFEQRVGNACLVNLSLLKKLNVELPISIYLTLTGVKKYTIALQDENAIEFPDEMMHRYIDRDMVQTSEVVIDSYEFGELPRLLRPMFDQVWKAAGWHEARNYHITSY